VTTDILFHTAEEKNPWFELDLGAVFDVGSIEVVNRRDCCAERAIPLRLEVSIDRASFREVARHTEPFRTWRASFDPVKARYIRARVTRRSVLHLERLVVRNQ
jgi:hypothetical protein